MLFFHFVTSSSMELKKDCMEAEKLEHVHKLLSIDEFSLFYEIRRCLLQNWRLVYDFRLIGQLKFSKILCIRWSILDGI